MDSLASLHLDVDARGFLSNLDRDQVFHKIRQRGDNRICFDCAARNATWISTTFAIFLCLSCSGQHRNLGAKISFIRSSDLDMIRLEEAVRMELGGNSRALAYFRRHGVADARSVDYRKPVAQRYRRVLDTEVEEIMTQTRPELSIRSPPVLNSESPSFGPQSNGDLERDYPTSTAESRSSFPKKLEKTSDEKPSDHESFWDTSDGWTDSKNPGQTTSANINKLSGNEKDSSAAHTNSSGHQEVKPSNVVETHNLMEPQIITGPKLDHHFSAGRPTPSKVKSDDFDFDFDSAFQTAAVVAPKQQEKPKDLSNDPYNAYKVGNVKQARGSYGNHDSDFSAFDDKEMDAAFSDAVEHLPQSSTSNNPAKPATVNRLGGLETTRDLSNAKAISSDDFRHNQTDENVSTTDYHRFKGAQGISSDMFFNRESEQRQEDGWLDDQTSARLNVLRETAMQRASDLSNVAQETIKNAASWFSRFSQLTPSYM